MGSYSGTADRPDKAKAIGAVVAVHAALAFIILSGLNVRMIQETVDRMKTFNVEQPPPPPPRQPPPKPTPKPEAMKREAGAPARKAEATPVVAPQPKLAVRSPIVASPIAGTGSAAHPGAGTSGTGTGAGGTGTGLGGGGYADYSRFTPARLINPLRNRDYQALTANRLPTGSGDMAIVISPTGRVTACRLIRRTGDPIVDAGLCSLIAQRLLFSPARDDQGRPIAYSTNYHAQWSQRW